MEEASIKEAFTTFMEEHPDGTMVPKTFGEMMKKALPNINADKLLKHVFRVYDTNKDGYIDFIEFMVIYHIMAEGTPEAVLGKIFSVFDINNDLTISRKEMARLVKDMNCLIKEDNPSAQPSDELAKLAFTEMDQDQDGKITKQEFVAACLARQQISKMLALKIINIFVED